MKNYIFLTEEGYTFVPHSDLAEPEIENCQLLGFGKGDNAKEAFDNFMSENTYLINTSFQNVFCYEIATQIPEAHFEINHNPSA